MSDTEREALEAGSVWWEAELFRGDPRWQKLLDIPAARLSAEEQAFLDGPVEELCRMLDDWDITHVRRDLPPAVWRFLRKKVFRADRSAPIRRPGILGPGAFGGGDENRFALGHGGGDGDGAELARTGGAAAALRHRGAKEPLPPTPGERRGGAVFRAHQSRGRLGRERHARPRRRMSRRIRGQKRMCSAFG